MAYSVWVNHPTTPYGLDLVTARGLFVCDRDDLKGGGAGVIQPAVAAWAWDVATGAMKQFWPPPPSVTGPTISAGSDWRHRTISWSAPSAASVSVSAWSGDGSPVSIYSGSGSSVEWDWFNADPQFFPGGTVTYEVTAINSGGTTVVSGSGVLPTVPGPASAPTYSSTDYNSTVATWPAVPGASDPNNIVDYQVVNKLTGEVVLTTTSTSGTIALASPSTTYVFYVRARVKASYVGAGVHTGSASESRSVTSSPPPETGPVNGTYTFRSSSEYTYQWGESGGQSAQWRPSTDDLYHGDGGSVSTRGQQAAFFFGYTCTASPTGSDVGKTLAQVFPSGLGTKSVSAFKVRMIRKSEGGSSSAQTNRWGLHNHASKPSGAPTVSGAVDAGALAWGDDEWTSLSTGWGAYLVNGTYRGVVWGKVAGRYMIAAQSTEANGDIQITIAN